MPNRNSLTISGKRIFYDDLVRIHAILARSGGGDVSIEVRIKGVSGGHSLADITDLKQYVIADIDELTLSVPDRRICINHGSRYALFQFMSDEAARDICEIAEGLEALPRPGGFAYLLRHLWLDPYRADPHRVDLYLQTRAEYDRERIVARRHRTAWVSVAVVTVAAAVIGAVATLVT